MSRLGPSAHTLLTLHTTEEFWDEPLPTAEAPLAKVKNSTNWWIVGTAVLSWKVKFSDLSGSGKFYMLLGTDGSK